VAVCRDPESTSCKSSRIKIFISHYRSTPGVRYYLKGPGSTPSYETEEMLVRREQVLRDNRSPCGPLKYNIEPYGGRLGGKVILKMIQILDIGH